jgi:hypothetical protein
MDEHDVHGLGQNTQSGVYRSLSRIPACHNPLELGDAHAPQLNSQRLHGIGRRGYNDMVYTGVPLEHKQGL